MEESYFHRSIVVLAPAPTSSPLAESECTPSLMLSHCCFSEAGSRLPILADGRKLVEGWCSQIQRMGLERSFLSICLSQCNMYM
jgi:hypothetical protein